VSHTGTRLAPRVSGMAVGSLVAALSSCLIVTAPLSVAAR
jgi:hypothetical protein